MPLERSLVSATNVQPTLLVCWQEKLMSHSISLHWRLEDLLPMHDIIIFAGLGWPSGHDADEGDPKAWIRKLDSYGHRLRIEASSCPQTRGC